MSEITEEPAVIRTFGSGATRNVDTDKLDFEGFLHPLVLRRFAEYMHVHRLQADGSLRASDNWQKGIPADVYMKSLFRHFMDVWSLHRGIPVTSPETGQPVEMVEALMACLFNVQGYAFELLGWRPVVEVVEDTAGEVDWDQVRRDMAHPDEWDDKPSTGITNLNAGDSTALCELTGSHQVNEPHLPACYVAANRSAA